MSIEISEISTDLKLLLDDFFSTSSLILDFFLKPGVSMII